MRSTIELDKRQRPRLNDADVAWQIYDLLGYGSLTAEIVDYLEELLSSASEWDKLVQLFRRLHKFYEAWCEGFYIDKAPGENWPQIKLMQMSAVNIPTGLRQVDICVGLNVTILLFRLRGYGQQQTERIKRLSLHFHPCGNMSAREVGIMSAEEHDNGKLLRMIGYSQLLGFSSFTTAVGPHLSGPHLSGANLGSTDLSSANLIRADLSSANLSGASLSAADLRGADLSSANLSNVALDDVRLDEDTNWW